MSKSRLRQFVVFHPPTRGSGGARMARTSCRGVKAVAYRASLMPDRVTRLAGAGGGPLIWTDNSSPVVMAWGVPQAQWLAPRSAGWVSPWVGWKRHRRLGLASRIRSQAMISAPWFGLGVSLGIGLLIGLERERSKGIGSGRRPAGIRTFTLASLLGAVAMHLGGEAFLALVTAGVG